jgi:hypothetical protein
MPNDRESLPHIVIVGDPISGLSFYGPFENWEAASIYTDNQGGKFDADWWTAPIVPVGSLTS